MTAVAYAAPPHGFGMPSSPTVSLPPIQEAVPEVRTRRPRAERSLHDPPEPPGPPSRLAQQSLSLSFPPSPKRRRISRPVSGPSPTSPESAVMPYQPVHLPAEVAPPSFPVAARSDSGVVPTSVPTLQKYPTADAVSPPTSHSDEPRTSPYASSLPSTRRAAQAPFPVEVESPDRPTLPSIFGNDRESVMMTSTALGHPMPLSYPPPPPPFAPLPASPSSAPRSYALNPPPQPYAPARPYTDVTARDSSRAPLSTGPPPLMTYESAPDPRMERGGSRRRRGNLPRPVTDVLRHWFHGHLNHPYPSEEEKQALMLRTGLTMSQISNWFINSRRRQLPALQRQERATAIAQEHHEGGGGAGGGPGPSSEGPAVSEEH
ncbi:MAG: hypothetical protein M1817_004519 [Caeruleum heppii]|nr:MAG: hypothetical protein M1817_004519 [Caeruleum heppii]